MAAVGDPAATGDKVVPLARVHIPGAARVIASALTDDPGYRFLLPDDTRRAGELTALYRITLADTVAHGCGFVTMLGSSITGVVAIYPPGAYPMTLKRCVRIAGWGVLLAARAREHLGGLMRLGRLTAPGVPTHTWYVQAIGVLPDRQRSGLGTALLRAALGLVDQAGEESYLETTRPENVTYYARFGYALIHEPIPIAPGGPSIYPMLRRACASHPADAAPGRSGARATPVPDTAQPH